MIDSLSNWTPVRLWIVFVCGRDPGVGGARPEPSVDIDWLQMFSVASLALEIAFAARGIN